MVQDLYVPPGYRGKKAGAEGVTKFTRGKAIRHVEENTLEELGITVQPWKVTLGIIRDGIDPRAHEIDYYVRAPGNNPGAAAMFADRLWQKWEKQELGLGHRKYPDTSGEQMVERIDDREWMDYWSHIWKKVRDLPEDRRKKLVRFVGPSRNPSGFVYWPDEQWDPRIEEF